MPRKLVKPLIQVLADGPETGEEDRAKPHILFIIDGFPKALGGGERVVLRLAKALPQYGFRASILTFSYHPESAFHLADAPCPVYLLELGKAVGLRSARAAWELRRFIRRQHVELVQTFFESSDLWGGLVTRLLSPAKLVWSRRDMGILRGKKHTTAYRSLRRLPHAVVAVSQKVAGHVRSVDGVPPQRVHVVYNGLDLNTAALARRAGAAGAPVITTVGNIRRVKGHDLLLRAAPAVLSAFPQATFSIAGEVLEPDYFSELKRLAVDLGIEDHVQFVGKITDLPAHFTTADLFVLPSRSEGFSNALIEAMAAGLPSIATDVGGNAEAIESGKNGLIVPPEDVSALQDAILATLQNPEFAAELSIAGRHSVEQRFTTDAMLRATSALFRDLLR